MSAMTRNFAPEHMATQAMADYYARRADDGLGLILTEGIIVHPTGDGYRDVPYIATEREALSWRPVVERIHRGGGTVFAQLWHCGRISHSDFTGGVAPISSTARAADGMNRQNDKPFGVPHAIKPDEMPEIYKHFAQAGSRALAAGFDGIELHFGHGYLPDQFLDGSVNDRTDAYGGTVEGRCRFSLELLEAVTTLVPPERVMIRISPSREMGAIHEWPDMEAMLAHLLPSFSERGVRLLDISCARSIYRDTSGKVARLARRWWPHTILGGASLTLDEAEAEVQAGVLDLVTWGRHVLANPDFVTRLRTGEPLRPFDRTMLDRLE
jgi:N-ethylmaleimide reductase